jgi:hypothetical protein
MLNYDTSGLFYDVQAGKDLRYDLEYPIECVLPMHGCIDKCLELLPYYKIDTLDLTVIEKAIEGMQAGLAIERCVVHQVTSPHTPLIRSFDLFDTLLGRMHYRPDSIYELVEKLYPFPGFSFFRVVAECKSDHTLPGIYRELQKLIDISEKEAAKLMQFEFATELQYIFPIVENIDLVKDGDLIVSDTYYSTGQIKQLLDKLQLTKKVQIYATPQGKSSGTAWAFCKNNYRIESHLGDSLHSDVTMAKLQKIEANHYTNGQLSSEEQALLQKGQRDLSYLCRALRLSNPYEPNSADWHLWNDQCKLNVPILIHASLYLHAFCQTHKKRRILFTSRDGCLWVQVFRQMFPQYESIYFQSSRHVYMHASDSYIEYARSLYNDETVITDAQGKGTSCEHFFKTHLQACPTYLAIINCGAAQHGIMRVETGCEQIEMLNYDTRGTLYDMQNGEALRRELEYPAWVVPPMHASIKKCVELLPFYNIDVFDQTVVEAAVQAMRSGIALNQYLLHAYWHSESYHDFIKSIQQVKNSLFFSASKEVY